MTGKEKMLAGELYDPSDEELAKAHARAQELCVEYNGLKQSDERRKAVLAELMPGLGKDSYIQGPIWTDYGTNITTGECFYANFNLTILDCGEIKIGNNVMFGPNVSLYAAYHPLDYKRRNMRRREDGTLYGDNADAYGFAGMVRASGIQIDGKKTLVLGSGGASSTVCAVPEEMGARSVTIISRKGEDNYNNLDRHADAEVIVNTTPVGMYPNCGVSPVDLSLFPKLEGVLDIVYNPARTAFVLQAEKLGIPYMSGLYMLVAQAKRTAEVFENRDIPDSETERIWKKLSLEMQNIVLVGMPGSGKSTVAARLAEKIDRIALDSDAEIEEKNGMSCAQLIEKHGEAEFRELESEAIAALGKRSGAVIATGGGCVTREENYDLLHQNGIIFWLKRNIDQLPREGRPLSAGDLAAMYDRRKACYERFADHIVDNNGTVEDTVQAILDCLK